MTIATFLAFYHFDVGHDTPATWSERWRIWPEPWLWAALLEALYQGRYKAVSVDYVLQAWRSRGEPRLSFTPAFVQDMWPDAIPHVQPLWERRSIAPTLDVPTPHHPFDDVILPAKWLSLLNKTSA